VFRGAKTAMTLALKSPELVANLIAVDNAPVDAILSRDFPRYVRGMKSIQEANVTRQSDADKILEKVETVRFPTAVPCFNSAFIY
jgi:pimeloyl-ACP methyl ester carboxylesterase